MYTFYGVSADNLLGLPALQEGEAGAGKRVIIRPDPTLPNIYHTLYLPKEWQATGKKLPIIFEYTGNYYPKTGSTGRVEEASLGYGITQSEFIWVVLPFVDSQNKRNAVSWWGDIKATVHYAKQQVPKIIQTYHVDANNVFLSGFSRGAIAVNFIGLHDDEISRHWSGFITHDHFDGVREWKKPWGAPLKQYRKAAKSRLNRVGERPYLVSQNGSITPTQNYLNNTDITLDNFTFLEVNTQAIQGQFPNKFAQSAHNDTWLLLPSDTQRIIWQWLQLTMK